MGSVQDKFATLLGISVRTLQNWEQGRREPLEYFSALQLATLKQFWKRSPERIDPESFEAFTPAA